LAPLIEGHGLDASDDADIILISPVGEDAATMAVRLGLDPARIVAVDLTTLEAGLVTLMVPLGAGDGLGPVAAWLESRGLAVIIIRDSPGFVAQRLLAMIANLGCEMAQIGIGSPEDIDLAMKLALNYPRGPLELAEHLGLRHTLTILTNIQAITGSDRYRPSLWLRRRALLGRAIHERD
jgi:3-hydroxybutyryl-CoA dehydrogenase